MTHDQQTVVKQLAASFYNKPHRYYHNWTHIEHVLRSLTATGPLSPELFMAAVFHDIVYDATSPTNEEDSAYLFEHLYLDTELAGIEVNVERVKQLIMATKTHDFNPKDLESCLLVKADLEILCAEPAAFADYENTIAQEYSFVPRSIYIRERIKVLRKLKDKLLDNRKYFSTAEIDRLYLNVNCCTALLEVEGQQLAATI